MAANSLLAIDCLRASGAVRDHDEATHGMTPVVELGRQLCLRSLTSRVVEMRCELARVANYPEGDGTRQITPQPERAKSRRLSTGDVLALAIADMQNALRRQRELTARGGVIR